MLTCHMRMQPRLTMTVPKGFTMMKNLLVIALVSALFPLTGAAALGAERFVHVPGVDEPMVPIEMLRSEPQEVLHLDGAGCARPDLLTVGGHIAPDIDEPDKVARERSPWVIEPSTASGTTARG